MVWYGGGERWSLLTGKHCRQGTLHTELMTVAASKLRNYCRMALNKYLWVSYKCKESLYGYDKSNTVVDMFDCGCK